MATASKLFDYDVRDPAGNKLGTVEAVWEDERTGGVEFLGVRATWLVGRIHLVPLENARIDDANRAVHVRWTEDQVRTAPSFNPAAEIRPDEEAGIYAHFGMAPVAHPPGSGALPTRQEPTTEPHVHRALRHEEHLRTGSWGPPGP